MDTNKSLYTAILFFLLSLSGASSAAGDLDRAQGIIGILPLPEVFGDEPCEQFSTQPIPIFPAPHYTKNAGRIYVSKPWTFYPTGGCGGLEVSVSVIEPSPNDKALPTLEFAYEKPGAIVLERDGSWYKIALHNGAAWINIEDDSRYLPVEQLLKGALTYLRINGGMLPLVKNPGQGKPFWPSSSNQKHHLPVEVLDFKTVSGKLWVKVSVLEVAPCSREETNVPPTTGWLPFLDANELPAVWFYSRGC